MDKYLGLLEELKKKPPKTMEHEGENDTNQNL